MASTLPLETGNVEITNQSFIFAIFTLLLKHCFFFLFSGQDAFDYFTNEPDLFDVVCYALFIHFGNLIVC